MNTGGGRAAAGHRQDPGDRLDIAPELADDRRMMPAGAVRSRARSSTSTRTRPPRRSRWPWAEKFVALTDVEGSTRTGRTARP
ncbi:hypothetical protein QJS66_06295 [Kocuria rhizophila]|nr:hypothetical protein QJS66_06295 [Kocuria rhizophila]